MRGQNFTGKVNIVHYVTRKYMMIHKKRTVTAFAGIVFMVLLMTCVFVGKDTASAFMQEAGALREGRWHYAVYEVNGRQQQELEDLGFIDELEVSQALGMTEFARSANEMRPYLNVKAYGKKCFDWYRVQLTEGRIPQNEHEIIISSACREDGSDIQIGDTLQADFFRRTFTGLQDSTEEKIIFPFYGFFEIAGGETAEPPEQFPYFEENEDFRENREMTGKSGSYKVVGFMEVPVYEKAYGAGYTAFTLLGQDTLSDKDIRNVSLMIDFERAPAVVRPVLEEIAGTGNVDANDYYLAFGGNSSDSTMNLMVNLLTVFFVALIALASIILIYNVFQLSFRERCMYLGMLSSAGATARQRRSSIYYEACCLLLAAIPVGTAGGLGVIWAGMTLLKPFLVKFAAADGFQLQDIPVTLYISWQGLAAVVAASIVTVLVSVLLPARSISRIGAVDSIRGNERHRKKRQTYKTSRFVYHKNGAEKMLAVNGLRRQGRKNRSICVSVTVFLVILIVTAFGADTVHVILEKKTGNPAMISLPLNDRQGVLADLSHTGMDDEENARSMRRNFLAVKEELRASESVQDMKEWYEGIWCSSIGYQDQFFSQEYLDARMEIAKAYLGRQLSDEEIMERYFTDSAGSACILVVDEDTLEDMAERSGADQGLLADASKTGVLVFSKAILSTDNMRFENEKPQRYLYYDIAHISKLKQGEKFPVDMYSKDTDQNVQQMFTVAGYADEAALEDHVSFSGEFTWFIMGTQTAQVLADRLGYMEISELFEESDHITFAPGSDRFMEELLTMSGDPEDGFLFQTKSTSGMRKTMGEALAEIVDIMLGCFVALASVICFLNMGNSIGGRIEDRRKEFAVLRSAGMTEKQMRRMLFMEYSGILLSAVTAAACISVVLVCGMRYVLSSLFGRLELRIPGGFMVLCAAAAAGAVYVMAFYAFRKEKGENLIAWMREETV